MQAGRLKFACHQNADLVLSELDRMETAASCYQIQLRLIIPQLCCYILAQCLTIRLDQIGRTWVLRSWYWPWNQRQSRTTWTAVRSWLRIRRNKRHRNDCDRELDRSWFIAAPAYDFIKWDDDDNNLSNDSMADLYIIHTVNVRLAILDGLLNDL